MPNELVHVIDDDDAMRDSLTFLLTAAKMQVKTYASAREFLSGIETPLSGCIVTDVRMPDVDGIELLRRLNSMAVRVPVIMITGHGDVPLAVEAMKLGASEFLEKPFGDEALLSAIRAALIRDSKLTSRELERIEVGKRLDALSPRERDVLQGLIAGKPNKVIAFDLGISARTVEIYRANLMTKMQATSLSDLVRMTLLAEAETQAERHS